MSPRALARFMEHMDSPRDTSHSFEVDSIVNVIGWVLCRRNNSSCSFTRAHTRVHKNERLTEILRRQSTAS